MGRAGIEPATLGLKVDAAEFGRSRDSSQTAIDKPNQLASHPPCSLAPVDPALTHPVPCFGNERCCVIHAHQGRCAIGPGPNINTASGEGSPGYFENDDAGAPQLFFASLRPGGLGGADVWMSELQADGTWGPATPITELNSGASDTRTSISHDGLEIYLQSGRAGGLGGDDLWVATRDTVDAPWSTPGNLGAPVNTSANDVRPHLSADRETLFFASDRPGGSGALTCG
jgi:hypothetical protein